jgi:1,4-alpha-glucan branching enzyme
MFHVVGDFNDWSTTATPLNLSEEGWCVSLELDAGRSYQYRYLVDGKWFNDWKADGYEPNEHGGDNSVVVTVPHYERDASPPPRSQRKPRSGKPVLAYT